MFFKLICNCFRNKVFKKLNSDKTCKRKGFTLIELLVVISVISVLSSTVLAATNAARSKARDAFRISQLKQVTNALALYYNQNGSYPGNASNYGNNTGNAYYASNWAGMIKALNNQNYISATFSANYLPLSPFSFLIHTVYANAGGPSNCSIQDPLYKSSADYAISYAYAASVDNKSYVIRIKLENIGNPVLYKSVTGTFPTITNMDSVDCSQSNINLGYYCESNVL